jgi:hypothetical protein
MKSITLSIATALLVVTLLTSVGHFANTSLAQGNQTNQTGGGGQQNQTGGGGQQNQTDIGTASQMENLTSGNTGLLQNASDIGSQNTSMTGGMEQEQEAPETTSPASTQQQGNQSAGGGQQQQQNQTNMSSQQQQQNQTQQQQNQTQQQGNQSQGGPLEQLGEALGGIFGGK